MDPESTDKPRYLAIDLGAESGRVIAGTFDGDRVTLEELHRFENTPNQTETGPHWNLPLIKKGVLAGLQRAAQRYGTGVAGIGVDSWGCDYGLLDSAGEMLGAPYHYRNARTDGIREAAALQVSPEEHYARTGIAQLPFNTIYQLMAERADGRLDRAATLLQIPDLLHYWLCGERAGEITNASTTGALGVDGLWTYDLLAKLDVPSHMLLQPIKPGTVMGTLRSLVQQASGLGAVPIIAPPTHDTASAVAAVPALDDSADRRVYISSGTWSLLGVELDRPIVTTEARLAGFTNERGVGDSFRFLTNIMGLWLVQECRRSWARAGLRVDYDELTAGAAGIPSPDVVIDVDDPSFLHPADMPNAIALHLRRLGLPPISDPVALTRIILEALALRYREAVTAIERLTGTKIDAVHIVGGGSRNTLLCQLTADACGRPVLAGPTEATALGNILMQARAHGIVSDVREARQIVRNSCNLTEHLPTSVIDWRQREAMLPVLRAQSRRH